jgi:cytosine/adenosine deaminase-related metal-dependent hydrolase
LRRLESSRLLGVSFVEVFGVGRRQGKAVEQIRRLLEIEDADRGSVRMGLQPHAPYSCGLEVYRAAAASGRPVASHLAETPEELRFVAYGDGPLADLLRSIGVWDDSIVGLGGHPVEVLAEVLAAAPFVLAHLNYVEPPHIERLATWDVSVAYCPRASAYFGHPHDGEACHRYREMIGGGINVALGTDSFICLDTPDRISVLDEVRLLHERDGVDARTLLRMATVNGARALGVDAGLVDFSPGVTAGVLALPADAGSRLDPLTQVMRSGEAPEWIAGPMRPGS